MLLLFFARSLHDIVDAEQHASRLKKGISSIYAADRETQTSIAVLRIWIWTGCQNSNDKKVPPKRHTLTLALSYSPYDFMSTILPVSPSTPHECSPFACLALSSVSTRMALPPLFWTSVRGMTSIASATALNGHPSTPVTLLAFA